MVDVYIAVHVYFITSNFQSGDYEFSHTNQTSDFQSDCLHDPYSLLIKSAGCRHLCGLFCQTYNDFKHIRRCGRGLEVVQKVNLCIIKVTQKFEKIYVLDFNSEEKRPDAFHLISMLQVEMWEKRWNKVRKIVSVP